MTWINRWSRKAYQGVFSAKIPDPKSLERVKFTLLIYWVYSCFQGAKNDARSG
jgi:hypothetical protein